MHIDFECESLVKSFLSLYDRIISLSALIYVYIYVFMYESQEPFLLFSRFNAVKNECERETKGFFHSTINSYIGFYLYGSFYSFFRGIRLFFCEYHDDNNFYHFRICLELISGKMSLAEDVSRVLRVCRIVFGMSFALKSTADSKQ